MNAPARCETCRFFVPSEPDEVDDDGEGVCRRYPPTCLIDQDGDMVRGQPAVTRSYWCGEHRHRESP